MASGKNTELEKQFFEKFRIDYVLPEGIVTYVDKSDVIIEGSRKIGIEISHLYIKDGNDLHSEQRQRKLRELVLQSAQAQFFASGGLNIEIQVSFDTDNPITNIKGLAKNLVKLLLNLHEVSTGWLSKEHFSEFVEITDIYIYAEKISNIRWKELQVHTGKSLCVDRVAEIINNKNKKLNEYQLCDAYWLLLIVDFWDPAQDQDIRLSDDLFLESICSPFEKIIVYKSAERLYVELPISPINGF